MKLRAMNTSTTSKNFLKVSSVLSLAFTLVACSGDGRPFEEAVEITQLNLKQGSLSIKQPEGLLTPLYVNPGEQINFSVSAINDLDETVDLSPAGRRWSVGQPALASIDGNGRFTAIADGTVDVNVQIGGLEAVYPVTISNSVLSTITAVGAASIERCRPETYSAKGFFMDGSERGVSNVDWSTPDLTMGSVSSQPDDNSVSVTAFNAGMLNLVATVGDVNSTAAITVENNLQSIDITPMTLAVMSGSTLQLTATGLYGQDGEGENTSFNITESVTWSVPADNGVATVSNEESSKGLITGANVGNIDVKASCGDDKFGEKELVVIENDGSGSGNLAFEEGANRTIFLSRGPIQLNVSNGSVYDDENPITFNDETTWSVTENTSVAAFQSTTKGLITPLREGTATIRVLIDSEDDDIVDARAFQTIIVKP